MENFFKLVSKRTDISYITQIDLVDYINAYKILKKSIDKKIIKNTSLVDLFIKIDNKPYKISAGSEIKI